MGKASLQKGAGTWLPSLRKGKSDWQCMLDSLGALYTHGVEVNWAGFDRDYQRSKLPLPTSPFERKRYWLDLPGPRVHKEYVQSPSLHPLLERRLRSALSIVQFETTISTSALHTWRIIAFMGQWYCLLQPTWTCPWLPQERLSSLLTRWE